MTHEESKNKPKLYHNSKDSCPTSQHTIRKGRRGAKQRLSRIQKITLEVIKDVLKNTDRYLKPYANWFKTRMKKERAGGYVSYHIVKWEVCKRTGKKDKYNIQEDWRDDMKTHSMNPQTKEERTTEAFFIWYYSPNNYAHKREDFINSFSRSIRNLEDKDLIQTFPSDTKTSWKSEAVDTRIIKLIERRRKEK